MELNQVPARTAGPMVCLTSWPYDQVAESRRKAADLFARLKAALAPSSPTAPGSPFGAAHEIALIDAGEWWMVAVSGLPDRSGTLAMLDDWFATTGGTEQPTSNEFHSDPAGDLRALVGSRGWGRVVEAFTTAPDGGVTTTAATSAGPATSAGTAEPAAPPTGVLRGHDLAVLSCAISPDGRWIATGETGYPNPGAIRVWDATARTCVHVLPGETTPGGGTALVFGPGGDWFASMGGSVASGVYPVRIWDTATGGARASLVGHTRWLNDVAVAPDGSWLASASDDHTLRIWDVASGECRHILTGHEASVARCVASPDGTWVASAGGDGTVRIWDVASGECRHILTGHDGEVHALAVGAGGSRLASAGSDTTVRVWDVPATGATPVCRHVLRGHADAVFHLAMTPDGARIVSACDPVQRGEDLQPRVWNAETGGCVAVLRGHTDWVTAVALGPGGAWVVSASRDDTLRMWELETGRCLHVLSGHDGGVTSCAVSRDGGWVVSTSYDATVRIWDATTGAGGGSLGSASAPGSPGDIAAAAATATAAHPAPSEHDRRIGTIAVWLWERSRAGLAVDVVTGATRVPVARGRYVDMEAHPTAKGVYRLVFDNSLAAVDAPEGHQWVAVGSELTGVVASENSLVLDKGGQRVEVKVIGAPGMPTPGVAAAAPVAAPSPPAAPAPPPASLFGGDSLLDAYTPPLSARATAPLHQNAGPLGSRLFGSTEIELSGGQVRFAAKRMSGLTSFLVLTGLVVLVFAVVPLTFYALFVFNQNVLNSPADPDLLRDTLRGAAIIAGTGAGLYALGVLSSLGRKPETFTVPVHMASGRKSGRVYLFKLPVGRKGRKRRLVLKPAGKAEGARLREIIGELRG